MVYSNAVVAISN